MNRDVVCVLSCQITKVSIRKFGAMNSMQKCDPLLRYCRNIRPTWVKFDSKDTKESGSGSRF